MRLLHAMAGARHGGAEAFFLRLVEAIARCSGSDIAQAVAVRRHHGRRQKLRAAGAEVVEAPFGGWLDFRTRPSLEQLIDSFRPDVAVTWMSRTTIMLPPGRFVHAGRLGGYYDLKHYRRCDHLIGNTRDIALWIVARGWPAERAHYLPNLVDATPVASVDRVRIDTPAGAPVVFGLGRLHPNKGFDVLLQAVAALPDASSGSAASAQRRRSCAGWRRASGSSVGPAFSAGATTSRPCSAQPTCSSAPRGASRSAT